MARSNNEKYKRSTDDPDYDWLQPPGIFCDTFTTNYFPPSNVVRISFGEYVSNEHMPIYRTAVVLPMSDARLLARRLIRLVREAEEESAKKADTPADTPDEEAGS